MKKLFTLTIMMVLAMHAYAVYDFSAVCETGQTLYYKYYSGFQVSLVPPGIGNWSGYSKPVGDLIIPETVEHEGITYRVTIIWNHTFKDCTELTSVEIPNSVTNIYNHSFFNCTNLSNLVIGASVNTIDNSAFVNCTSLQTIYCHAQNPPTCHYIPGNYCEFFQNTPTDIPVYVSCLTIDQYLSHPDWSRFTNIQGEFYGTASLTVGVNNTDFGTAEIVSIPEDCDSQTATVRATANPNHRFSYWKRGVSIVSLDSEYTFVLNENYSLTAYFDCSTNVETIAFPDHVIGRVFGDEGQISDDHPSDFIYSNDGILTNFEFPEIISSSFSFYNYPSKPSNIYSLYYYTHPLVEERYNFSYNTDDQIKQMDAYQTGYGLAAHYYYYYDSEKRLYLKERFNLESCFQRLFSSYADGNRTRIDSVVNYDYELVRNSIKTTTRYSQRMLPLTVQTERYNGLGEYLNSSLETYSYTLHNKTDSIIKQTLIDGEWINSGIVHYIYDDMDRVVEYQTGIWSAEDECWDITMKTLYEFDDEDQKFIVSFRKKNDDEWIWDVYSGQTVFYEPDLNNWNRIIENYDGLHINQFEIDLHYVTREIPFPWQSEWYYEIQWDDGSTTYQHLEYTSDTTIDSSRPKVIVRSNTHYDRDTISEVTHEYILEEGNKVYWWNKDLQEFTVLYDYAAEPGDEWEIKVGTEYITVHVDDVDIFEYDGKTYKRLYISDIGNIFNGEIVVGLGHMTSFFPEKLMNQGKGFRVDGLRCYWVGDALLYHNGDENCDAVHSELQDLDETMKDATFVVYPNPANNILFVETHGRASLQDQTYRITNLMGQTLLQGNIMAETQQIDMSNLTKGMYFITIANQTRKFVIK